MSTPVVLITGALSGIGRATAAAFAKNGASVVASGRREAEGKALEAELRSLGAERLSSAPTCGMKTTCVI
jgi:NAD(P)-dependent dehydrogenase (short-subunit alcohol dehydrogenase family)